MVAIFLAAGLFVGMTPAIQERIGPHAFVAGPLTRTDLSYGADARQTIGFYARGKRRAPLIVYLHGGGWSLGSPGAGRGNKPEHLTARGFAYATIGYRLVPAVTVEQQLEDAALAVATLRRRPEVAGRAIVLMGHSSGAHLVAMLATDPRWLERAGVPFKAVRAAVLLDPAALDIAGMMAFQAPVIEKYYRPAFGADPARHAALSPLAQAAPPNAPAWLVLHDIANQPSAAQARQLAAAMGPSARVSVQPIAGTTHLRLNDELGRPGDAATALLDGFLAEVVPETRRARLR